jgi:hypothetical protein
MVCMWREADPRLVFRILGRNVLAPAAIVREHQRLVFSLGFTTDDYEYHAIVWTLHAFSFEAHMANSSRCAAGTPHTISVYFKRYVVLGLFSRTLLLHPAWVDVMEGGGGYFSPDITTDSHQT